MPEANAEIYNEATGRLQWSARHSPLTLVSKVTQNSVATALVDGTGSLVTFEFATASVNQPCPAFRCSQPFAIYTIDRNLPNWRINVLVRAPAGTPVTMYLFDNTPPAAFAGGLELYNPSGVRTFSLAMRPARIVGQFDQSTNFNGIAGRAYAVIRRTNYARYVTNGSGPTFSILEYIGQMSINEGTGVVDGAIWNHRSYTSTTSIGSLQRGAIAGLVVDVTNY